MKRKRITQLFPFLLPIRRTQRKIFFYAKMHFDRNRYAKTKVKNNSDEMKNGGIMKKRERIKTVFLYGIFICYILLLIKILLLSRVSLLELFNSQRTLFRSINLIPFHSIMEYISGSSDTLRRFAFGNVVGNIVVFIPLGIYLPLFKKDKRVLVNLLFIFIVSLFVEIIQGYLVIGVSDIDDIILNCLGGWIGILGYKFLLFILRDEKKVHTAITIPSAIVGLPVILYLLFMVKMRF